MRYISLLSIAVFLAACSGGEDSSTEEKENILSTEDSASTEDTLALGWGEEPDTNGVEVFVEDLPSRWIMLSDVDGNGENMIINDWCEAETQNFSFEPAKGEDWQVYLGYGQDGEICEITFFEAYEEEEEGMRLVSGSFRFKASYDESVRFVDFWWNEDEMIGHFDGLGMGSEWFVPEDHQDEYTVIEEDCEGLWEMTKIKEQFLLHPEIHYLNHGSFGGCPKPVFDEYQRFQTLLETEPLQFMVKTGVSLLDVSKQALADYINCPKEDLVYVTNPTTAMNVVIKSLALNEGDEILSTDHEYGAMNRTWNYYCQKAGAKYVQQNISLPIQSKEAFLEEFWSGYSANTKAIFISQITSPSALVFPVKEICKKAKELGLITIVDGAHVPAHIELDISELDVDFYTGACHKWLCSPKGSSFLYTSKEYQEKLDPLIISWGYEADQPSESIYQDYHQYQGTRDFSAFLTTPACIKFQKENNWEEEKEKCRSQLKHYYPIVAKELNSAVICPVTDAFLGQICSIPVNTGDPVALKELLYDDYKIEIPVFSNVGPINYLRISFMPYNDESEIEVLINAIRDIKSRTSLIS